jgi:hypothetical protein
MKKITSCSVAALGLSLISGAALADTGGANSTPSSNPQTSSYSLIPYVTVGTSPYDSMQTAYDASDVWSQQSSMNEDLTILKYKQTLQNHLQQVGVSLDQRPIIEISGGVAGTATQTFSNFSGPQNTGDFSLSTAEIDVNAMASKWATGFMSLGYDSSTSEVFVSRGFVTIGNLDKSPFYLTAGQVYLPFGRYYSGLITAPLTLSLARIEDQAVILGYSKNNFSMQGYAYPGINANADGTVFHAGGFNANYKMIFNPSLNLNVGSGVISDMTDAQGMRSTGASAPQFPGFTSFSGSGAYPFVHAVPGADVHAEFNFWTNTLAGEFIGAARQFDAQDLSYNGDGAQPQAMHLELTHTFKIQDRPSTVGVAYGRSWQALGLDLPQNSYMAYFLTSIWKNTLEEIEFRHDQDYSSNDIATAVSNPNAQNTFGTFTNTGTGKNRDMVTLQFGVYF